MKESEMNEVLGLIQGQFDLSAPQISQAIEFYRALIAENQIQNLTRLTSPRQFVDGHLADVVELKKAGCIQFPAMDWGSGCGVPGLLFAAVYGGNWVLAESEASKARFLSETAEKLGLKDTVTVYSGRGEDYLKKHKVGSIVARAVGSVGKFYAWAANCSTWNNLVLLKAKAWSDEWKDFSKSNKNLKWKISRSHPYTVGPDSAQRIIAVITPN